MGLAVLRAGLATDAELIQAGWRTGSTAADVGLCARTMGRLVQPKSLATEQKVLGVLQGAVDACLGAYPSSLQQDQAELQQLSGETAAAAAAAGTHDQQQRQEGEQQLIRVAMLKGLISEKVALVEAKGVLGGWLQQLGEMKGTVKPEQIAVIYAHCDESEDDS